MLLVDSVPIPELDLDDDDTPSSSTDSLLSKSDGDRMIRDGLMNLSLILCLQDLDVLCLVGQVHFSSILSSILMLRVEGSLHYWSASASSHNSPLRTASLKREVKRREEETIELHLRKLVRQAGQADADCRVRLLSDISLTSPSPATRISELLTGKLSQPLNLQGICEFLQFCSVTKVECEDQIIAI